MYNDKLQKYITKMTSLKDRVVSGSFQKHHIIPKCMGGDDGVSNIVNLTILEHIDAHLELADCFELATYERNANLSAANVLHVWLGDKSNINLNGINNPMWGKTHSIETKEKIGTKSKQKVYSDEYRNKLSIAQRGNKNHRWGIAVSDETKTKISQAQIGDRHHLWGKTRSDETKKRISKSQPNRMIISKYDINLNKLEIYESMHEACTKNGISQGNLSSYLKKTPVTKHGSYRVLGGFIWKQEF